MGRYSISKIFLKLGLFTALLLSACMGGGGGPEGGTPGAVGGGTPGGFAGNSLDGGGLDGAGGLTNAASGSGPVAMPAPDTVAWEPVTWVAYLMGCTNVPGPMVNCEGQPGSVDGGTRIRLTPYPPGQPGGTPKGASVETDADGSGAWNQNVEADAGDVVGICRVVSGNCAEVLYVVIPPEGGTVNGQQGYMKNLVIDKDGNKIFSRRLESPKASSWYVGFSFSDLFMGTAHADDVRAPYLIQNSNINWAQILLTTQQNQRESEDHDAPAGILSPIPYDLVSAECGTALNFVFMSVDQERREVMPGNEATLKRVRTDGVGGTFFPEVIAEFPGYTRGDINDVKVWQPREGDPKEYIAAAVGPHLYLVENGEHPAIKARIDFGLLNQVQQVLVSDQTLYVFLRSKGDASGVPNPLYRVNINPDNSFRAACTRTTDILPSLRRITDFEPVSDKVAFLGETNEGRYILAAGNADRSFVDGNDIVGVDLALLRTYANPVEIAVLEIKNPSRSFTAGRGIRLLALDPVARKLELLDYNWGTPPESLHVESYSFAELGLEDLRYPHNMTSDESSRNVALIDIRESGSELVNLSFGNGASEDGTARPTVTVTRYSLGDEAPTVVRSEGNAWLYNSNQGEFRRVERGALTMNPEAVKDFITNPRNNPDFEFQPTFNLRDSSGDGDDESEE